MGTVVAITGAYRGSTSGVAWDSDWGWDRGCNSQCPDPCRTHAQGPLALALLPSGAKVPVFQGGESTQREGNQLRPDPHVF